MLLVHFPDVLVLDGEHGEALTALREQRLLLRSGRVLPISVACHRSPRSAPLGAASFPLCGRSSNGQCNGYRTTGTWTPSAQTATVLYLCGSSEDLLSSMRACVIDVVLPALLFMIAPPNALNDTIEFCQSFTKRSSLHSHLLWLQHSAFSALAHEVQ